MKKIYISFIVILFSINAFAQKNKGRAGYNNWLEMGLKGAGNVNFLMNTNIIDDVNITSPYSFGSWGGLKIGYNFTDKHAIMVDILYSGLNQKWKSDNDSMSFEKKIHVTYLDIPVMYRNYSDLTYFEIGPQYSMLMNAQGTFTSNGTPVIADKSKFNPTNISAVVGFGTAILGKDNILIMVGFRLTYGFMDMIKDHSGDYPLNTFPSYNVQTDLTGYKPTNYFSGGFTLEINYNFRSF